MTSKSSHIVFSKDRILISPDLIEVFDFLMEIEKEVKVVVEIEKRLENIKKHSLEFFDLIIHLAKKLEDNNIAFEYKIQDPETFPKNFDIDFPVRSQMIVIFSFLETVFNIYLAYSHRTSNEKEIRNLAMITENKQKFIDTYLLNPNNIYFKKSSRLRRINSKSLIYLRNSLNHFFSISGGIQINHSSFENETRKLEELFRKQGKNQVIFLSPRGSLFFSK